MKKALASALIVVSIASAALAAVSLLLWNQNKKLAIEKRALEFQLSQKIIENLQYIKVL